MLVVMRTVVVLGPVPANFPELLSKSRGHSTGPESGLGINTSHLGQSGLASKRVGLVTLCMRVTVT